MRESIKQLLIKYPHLRDSDNKLIASIWKFQIQGLGYNVMKGTIAETLILVANGRLTSSETIRRTRQKVQEEEPELRGASYKSRQRTGENVRKNINAA